MRRWLVITGFVGSALYVGLARYLIGDKLEGLANMPLNELGDFLAGVFSPLAFLWLVLGFLQQGKELRASTDALALQAKEMRASVEQHEALVKVTQQQHEIDAQARRAERLRYERLAQPVLVIESGVRAYSGGMITNRFELRNAGHQITHVRFRWSSEADVRLPKQLPVLPTEDSLSFEIASHPDLIQNFILYIDYIDGIGQPKQSCFLFSRQETPTSPHFIADMVRGEIIEA
ncbi:hypothetical protein [Pseudomonas saudiphocaensis]|uniref:hypothetical protein n=1 Tax=Pseudomonas saudiphocaensis TaxID=1499686 RepID=UPI000F77C7CF|nr:hypothetical protein [Pseudomonas saudiphocaensis]RRV18143.1 hypothetical protein EGJ00_02120 [Pseudomonas saudiphocaensis]